MKDKLPNRWLLAGAGVVMQVALGAVYAWSVFRDPLIKACGWSISEVTFTFSIAILTLGFAAFIGRLWMSRVGPRIVGMTAGVCYGLGVGLASLSGGQIWVLYLTYGVLGGLGLGLAYIVPIATLVKWFPDRRGFITGLAVAGFGGGALLTAPIASALIQAVGVLSTFAILGVIYFVMVVAAASLMQNPPQGWKPAGWEPVTTGDSQFVVLSCYGGGFGTMPAFATDFFGPKSIGSIYGLMLTAWGFAAVFGPLLIARIREASGSYGGALTIIAWVMLASSLLPLLVGGHRAVKAPVRAS
jgi:MFS family permease